MSGFNTLEVQSVIQALDGRIEIFDSSPVIKSVQYIN